MRDRRGERLCGAGESRSARVIGLDIDIARLGFARSHDPASAYVAGNGVQLPFPPGAFDLVLCHYLLLWIPSPVDALREMARVAIPGGWVIALAEPDHSARIDYPSPLEELGAAQTAALTRQGADPALGRRLAELIYGCRTDRRRNRDTGFAGYPRGANPRGIRIGMEDFTGRYRPGDFGIRMEGISARQIPMRAGAEYAVLVYSHFLLHRPAKKLNPIVYPADGVIKTAAVTGLSPASAARLPSRLKINLRFRTPR